MLINCFLMLAVLLVLFAAPWRAPKPLMTVRDTYLLIVAGLTQVVVLELGKPLSGPLFGALLVALWAFRNQHVPGAALLCAGTLGNGLAMITHGGAMPLAPSVAQELGLSTTSNILLPGSKDVIGQFSTWLWLSDWIVVTLPTLTLVISPGDVCIIAALCHWACACRLSGRQPIRQRPQLGNGFADDRIVVSA